MATAGVAGVRTTANANMTSGTLGAANGVWTSVSNQNAGTITSASGVYSYAALSGAGGITSYRAFTSAPPSITGAGGITNAYGLYLEGLKVTGVTNAYGVYQVGANDLNYFAGNIGIGRTSPAATLDVNGTMRLAKNAAQPVACSATNDGAIALTSGYKLCVCKGGTTSWVQAGDGTTACAW